MAAITLATGSTVIVVATTCPAGVVVVAVVEVTTPCPCGMVTAPTPGMENVTLPPLTRTETVVPAMATVVSVPRIPIVAVAAL